ncbi:unnamed protein product [Thelazia callipaeda]|uniref:Calponin-homology (CH) domain-containing protein n=1 Tax=Thelazia callipaeda TaxID=103827 RepID=A0A0N5CX24_THECL|nr:unnamed protein product [Thelazia callipaeda]
MTEMENSVPEIVPINCYNVEKGKLSASVKWLIGRAYGSMAPDLLLHPIRENKNNTFQLEEAVMTGLTNASLYSSAAAKIFKDQSLINKSHSVVLRALESHSIPLTTSSKEENINEPLLSSIQPFYQSAHLAVIDSLMIAHMRSIITIERVVLAVQNYTTVDKREEPMDAVDALLFWINKICLLVRDDMEKYGLMNKNSRKHYGSIVVPEMEDLYEDMCDGACICALIAFYRPNEMNIRNICFNDPMSLGDCHYNLMLLRKFCSSLSWNPFHFAVEDILYFHESLQANLNAFLADLFQIFEGDGVKKSSVDSPTVRSRHFLPIQGIPELRSHNAGSKTVNQLRSRLQPEMSRTLSAMSSDSLLPTKSGDSLRCSYQKKNTGLSEKTNFSELTMYGDLRSGAASGCSQGISYMRSDSMPAASVRLALEEKRREHEKRRYLETNQSESERVQKQKDAFFTLMQKLEKNSDLRSRATSEVGSSHAYQSQEISFLKETVQDLQKRLQEMCLQQEHLSRQVDEQRQMTHATSQPAIHTEFGLLNEPNNGFNNSYATLPHNITKLTHQSQYHTYATPYAAPVEQTFAPSVHLSEQNQMYPVPSLQMSMNGYSSQLDSQSVACAYSSRIIPNPQLPVTRYQLGSDGGYVSRSHDSSSQSVGNSPYMLANAAAAANSIAIASNTFRLHQNDASSSRLDPSLEINRNLTNWGLTYRAGQVIRPQRRTWDNGAFTQNSVDYSSQPIFPTAVHLYQQQQETEAPESVDGTMSEFLPSQKDSLLLKPLFSAENREKPPIPKHQQSPPKDPISSTGIDMPTAVSRKPSTTRSSQFVVDDVTEKSVINVTPEMEAKREALLAKTLRRREQIEQKVGEMEARNAERRQAELEKQEAAEQRKRERELQRQRILDDYKRKKVEKEMENNEICNGRGHSQPPIVPRSKNTEGINNRMKRISRPQSSFDESNASSSARVTVPSTAEPTLKLFSKYVHKSNRSMIINALQYLVFPGNVWDKQRNEVLGELAKSDSKHFLLLFRDQKCRYLGAYSWDQQSDTAHRIHGKGPNICHESMMHLMFKYDSGAKKFSHIPTKHLSATIDGFTLQDQYMQGPKIPHSASIHRNA